tara:strand:+ start:347 stop:787 length:441 start_codon:yes stop_codon:yes gene_type:complete
VTFDIFETKNFDELTNSYKELIELLKEEIVLNFKRGLTKSSESERGSDTVCTPPEQSNFSSLFTDIDSFSPEASVDQFFNLYKAYCLSFSLVFSDLSQKNELSEKGIQSLKLWLDYMEDQGFDYTEFERFCALLLDVSSRGDEIDK